MTNILTWIKNNILLAIGIAVLLLVLFFGKNVRRLFFGSRRVKHRPGYHLTHTRSGKLIEHRSIRRVSHKPIPRSVGLHKISGKGYPAPGGGHIPFKYNKDGTIKKAWQVAGTLAAKNRMKKLRRAR